MAAAGQITLGATVQNLDSGTKTVGPITVSMSAANGNTTDYALSVGFNTITLPISTAIPALAGTTPTAAIIIPAPTNTRAMVLKGVTGDTGIPMHLTNPFYLGFPASGFPASFGITVSTSATTCSIVWI